MRPLHSILRLAFLRRVCAAIANKLVQPYISIGEHVMPSNVVPGRMYAKAKIALAASSFEIYSRSACIGASAIMLGPSSEGGRYGVEPYFEGKYGIMAH